MELQLFREVVIEALAAEPRGDAGHGDLTRGLQHERDGFRQPLPIRSLAPELLLAGPGEAVKLGLAAGIRVAPLRLKPAALFQSVERWIKGPLLHLQHVTGNVLEALGNGVPMDGAERRDLQNQQVEGALQKVGLAGWHWYT